MPGGLCYFLCIMCGVDFTRLRAGVFISSRLLLRVGSSRLLLRVGSSRLLLRVGSSRLLLRVGSIRLLLRVGSSRLLLRVGSSRLLLRVGSSRLLLRVVSTRLFLRVGSSRLLLRADQLDVLRLRRPLGGVDSTGGAGYRHHTGGYSLYTLTPEPDIRRQVNTVRNTGASRNLEHMLLNFQFKII